VATTRSSASLFQAHEVTASEDRVPILGDESQVGIKFDNKVLVSADVDISGHKTS
jgi:hypothetical protein